MRRLQVLVGGGRLSLICVSLMLSLLHCMASYSSLIVLARRTSAGSEKLGSRETTISFFPKLSRDVRPRLYIRYRRRASPACPSAILGCELD